MNKKHIAIVVLGAVLLVALVVLINVYGRLGDLAAGQDALAGELNARHVELVENLEATGEDLAKLCGEADKLAMDLEATEVVLEERTVLFETALDDAEAKYGLLQDALKDLEDAYGNAWEQGQKKIDSLQRDLAQVRSSLDALERRMAQMGGTAVEIEYSIPLTYVEGGTYEMGSNDWDWTKPIHTVTVDSFYIGTYEVTQDIYEQVMGNNPSKWEGSRLPVEQVTWHDAIAFANALSRRDGLEEVYTINGQNVTCDWTKQGYRLPTEAEWEYAARGGQESQGYTYAGSNTVGDVAWYRDNSSSKTHEVGGKKANELDLYDMSGNVWEWCWDWYGGYSAGAQTNPTGPSSGSGRVFRGGSWFHYATHVRSANRFYNTPSDRYYAIGFRLVLPVQ
jgi:formylglycine-generating enzyme